MGIGSTVKKCSCKVATYVLLNHIEQIKADVLCGHESSRNFEFLEKKVKLYPLKLYPFGLDTTLMDTKNICPGFQRIVGLCLGSYPHEPVRKSTNICVNLFQDKTDRRIEMVCGDTNRAQDLKRHKSSFGRLAPEKVYALRDASLEAKEADIVSKNLLLGKLYDRAFNSL